MGFKIIKLTEDKNQDWDKFCLESRDAWFWQTSGWLEYILNYQPSLATENFSFFVLRGDKIRAIVPLTRETVRTDKGKVYEFSFGGRGIPAPALDNSLNRSDRELVYKLIFSEVDRLAVANGVKRAVFRQVPISDSFLNNKFSFNYFLKYGFIDASLNTCLINLGKTEDELLHDLRRNHLRSIKKANNLKIVIYNEKNITEEIFLAYKKMHYLAAGKQTRPDKTFNLMYEWARAGLGFLAVAEISGRPVGFEYYSVYKDNVYGFSAANDPEVEKDLPIRHALEWEAILWMKHQGFHFYEIGQQQYGPLLYDFPDQKKLNISHFKKGFGGFTAPLFIGEKYYDKQYFLKMYQERINKYADLIK
ncbi:MAG: GNAT family N-acetyltransferase [Patescibacteria group bacterium]|nr:GNAT family N-acetyltransferase [Patescibacteria group bacterium]